jgi:hypothetical protein
LSLCKSASDTYFRDGLPVTVDGQTLSIAAVTATSRYHASVKLDGCPQIKERITKSRKVISDKINSGTSVYGVSTGFGGSGTHLSLYNRARNHILTLNVKLILVPTSLCFSEMPFFNTSTVVSCHPRQSLSMLCPSLTLFARPPCPNHGYGALF